VAVAVEALDRPGGSERGGGAATLDLVSALTDSSVGVVAVTAA
jgi:hypothetical protein